MFYILESVCQNTLNLKVIFYVKLFVRFCSIFIPIVLIVKLIMDVYKNMIASKENNKEIISKASKRILASIIIFMIYPIVSIIFSSKIFENVSFKECWSNATSIKEIEELNKSVTLDINGNEIEGSTILECYSKSGCNLKLPKATRNNFEFYGWSESKECKSYIKDSYNVTKTGVILYPCFSKYKLPDAKKKTETEKTGDSLGTTGGSTGGDPSINATDTIFVGDSRTVGLCETVKMSSNETCVAKGGIGYIWFKNTAVSDINNIIKKNSNKSYNIIIDLGVNDLTYNSNYIKIYNSLKEGDWSNQNMIVISVLPANENKYTRTYKTNKYYISDINNKIKNFNSNMKNGLNSKIKYCDLYDKVWDIVVDEQETSDGLHYKSNAYKQVYTFKKSCI